MNKRKLLLILLGIVAISVLVIGIKAAIIYGAPMPYWAKSELIQSMVLEGRNAAFIAWLVKPVKWVAIGFGLFAILTAALVVSRMISNKTRPPSGPS